MKNKIDELIARYPVNYSQRIVADHPDVVDWVEKNTKSDNPIFMVRMYSAYHDRPEVCPSGVKRHIETWKGGFTYCGGGEKCKCRMDEFAASGKSIPEEEAVQIVQQFVSEKPKHFATLVSHRPELYEHVQHCTGKNVSERIYNFLNPGDNITCKYGKSKQFKSVHDGYVSCGRVSKDARCKCVIELQSKSIKTTLANRTTKEIEDSNIKRKETNIEKYGVECSAHSEFARACHRELYDDKEKVAAINAGIRATNLERYGRERPDVSEKSQRTLEKPTGRILGKPVR